jgi:hypothetical protein
MQAPDAVLTGLSVSNCGLNSGAMQVLAEVLPLHGQTLQELDISRNMCSMSITALSRLLHSTPNLVRLNVCGSVMGSMDGPLIAGSKLNEMASLRELDLSGVNINEETIEAIAEYLSSASAVTLRRLCLNNCRITGFGAARLFEATPPSSGHELLNEINGNPLETGVSRLARAVRNGFGPAYLHMNMVEFRDDSNYAQLLTAIALSSKLLGLSLIGSGPTTDDTPDTTGAFKTLFSACRSLRHLDLSGYSGRLDEGRLGGGFGLALDWLCKNQTLTHLRIRNQNLNEHREQVGRIIEQNRTVRYFDIQENDMALTTLSFLARSMKNNHTIIDFPISTAERDRIRWRQLRELKLTAALRMSKPAKADVQDELGKVVDEKIRTIQDITDRNGGNEERTMDSMIDYTTVGTMGDDWPSLCLLDRERSVPPKVHGSAIIPDRSQSQPYHVTAAEIEDGSDPTSPTSEVPTSPSWAGPSTPEEGDVPNLIEKFEKAGFISYG